LTFVQTVPWYKYNIILCVLQANGNNKKYKYFLYVGKKHSSAENEKLLRRLVSCALSRLANCTKSEGKPPYSAKLPQRQKDHVYVALTGYSGYLRKLSLFFKGFGKLNEMFRSGIRITALCPNNHIFLDDWLFQRNTNKAFVHFRYL